MGTTGAFSAQEVVPLQSRTAGAADSGILPEWGGRMDSVVKLAVTVVTGNVVVAVEHCDTAGGTYTAADTFPAQSGTTTGITRTIPGPLKQFVRIGWVITTGPVTFSVTLAITASRMT